MRTQASRNTERKTTRGVRAFERYDGRKFAIVGPQFGTKPLRGIARYERDDFLGSTLRIPVDGNCPGKPEILLAEKEWNGLITEGSQYGCDFCVMLLPEKD